MWDTTVASGAQRLIGQDAALVECRDRRLEGPLSALAGFALEAFRFPVRCPCSLACPPVSAARWVWGLCCWRLALPPEVACAACCRMPHGLPQEIASFDSDVLVVHVASAAVVLVGLYDYRAL